MKGKRYTEEQITYALRQAEGDNPVADVCRQLGVSEASFYLCKKKYGKLGMTEIREMWQLRDENVARLLNQPPGRVQRSSRRMVLCV